MIRYDLICKDDHRFEAWFSGSADFDDQAARGLLCCPICGTSKVEKAIMAPNVATSRKKEAARNTEAKKFAMMSAQAQKMAEAVKAEISSKCDYVGDKFAEEARAIHYGEKAERPIIGKASIKEAADLVEEGVGVAPIPEPFVPDEIKADLTKPDKKLN
ncbi:hypothetical protein DES40_2379 [Litorimonas taeanensis]|uniref:DUF1178 family protein n=1 Tax=Litorimonas taeanensis TaxID=568099 RepID=A0A420WF14_9PROT|nr:DUF1178 family protein [Litorimonas taeanensis]RKQ69578.1 hypothetical protein DES40_2379 [Litorimonas taeanensis]